MECLVKPLYEDFFRPRSKQERRNRFPYRAVRCSKCQTRFAEGEEVQRGSQSFRCAFCLTVFACSDSVQGQSQPDEKDSAAQAESDVYIVRGPKAIALLVSSVLLQLAGLIVLYWYMNIGFLP